MPKQSIQSLSGAVSVKEKLLQMLFSNRSLGAPLMSLYISTCTQQPATNRLLFKIHTRLIPLIEKEMKAPYLHISSTISSDFNLLLLHSIKQFGYRSYGFASWRPPHETSILAWSFCNTSPSGFIHQKCSEWYSVRIWWLLSQWRFDLWSADFLDSGI